VRDPPGISEKPMLRTNILLLAAALAGLAGISAAAPALPGAQEKRAAAASGQAKTGGQKLNLQETRGEGFFLQRCSICHLPRNLKFGSPATIGPDLRGQFKSASPDDLKALRGYILKGGPGMPGFQYGLEPAEVDDLIAFLKTL
jgi:mono/diheme cytochrome c family protein